MQASHLVLALSTAVNLAALAVFAFSPSLAPAVVRDFLRPGSNAAPAAATAATAKPPPAPGKLWPMLATEDLPTLIARLRATGFPAPVIREIVRAAVSARYEPRLRAYTDPDPSTPYWRTPPGNLRYGSGRWEEYSQLQRERTKLLRDLLADPFFATDDVTAAQRRQFGNLPPEKIHALQGIEDDYAEMMSAIRAGTNGILLAEDREKLAFLEREKKADLARVLSPAELADYEVRSSPITRLLSHNLGQFRPTEAEFRAIYDMHRRLNEAHPYLSGAEMHMQDRIGLQQQLENELRATIGEARYNDYVRETHSDFQQLRRMAQQANLPPGTAERAFDMRHTVSQESMRILNDGNLDPEAKRAALTTLAQTTRTQILSLLGPVAGASYVRTLDNQWLRALERGNAITFDGGFNRGIGSENVMLTFGSGMRLHSVTPPPRPR